MPRAYSFNVVFPSWTLSNPARKDKWSERGKTKRHVLASRNESILGFATEQIANRVTTAWLRPHSPY